MYRFIITLIVFCQAALLFGQKWTTNYQEALEKAKQENKKIVLVFSGSDWCAPCIKLKKEILSQPSFIEKTESKLVFVNADFPKKKANASKQSEIEKSQNIKLIEKYNKKGYFPLVVVIEPIHEKNIGILGYEKITGIDYADKLLNLAK